MDEDFKKSEQKDSGLRAFSALFPFGSSIYEIYSMINPPLHKKRLDDWYKFVAKEIDCLKRKRNIDLDAIKSNEEFNTFLMKTSLLVIQNHQKEKLECFKNITLNVLIDANHDFDRQMMFLDLVDSLTVAHLQVLLYLNDPENWCKAHEQTLGSDSQGIIGLLIGAFKDRLDSKDFALLLVSELQNQGLIKKFNPTLIIKSHNYIQSYTTKWGKQFIDFISQKEI